MRPVYFNGKFYAGRLNGVHRVADRLIREVDSLLAARDPADRPPVTLLCASRAEWTPRLEAIGIVRDRAPPSQRWEQLRLPRLARDGVLVNLANLAPLFHRRQLTLIHDVQFLFPDGGFSRRQRWGYRLLVPRMARASRRVLTVSEYSRQMLEVLGVVGKDRVSVLYNGTDHILDVAAARAPEEEQRRFVLMFGSSKPYKNNRVVFEAFHDAALAGFDLVVVGPQRATLEAAGLAVPERACFVGACDDSLLRRLYETAHCLVFPSRTEGFGLPPVEAMHCGCPVVVAPAGALPEICRDAVCYADVDDPASWCEAILALGDADRRNAKIAAGRARAELFSWSRAGERLLGEIMALAADPA
jgi:glycosyltransferase involved in cell wall biosynthesis